MLLCINHQNITDPNRSHLEFELPLPIFPSRPLQLLFTIVPASSTKILSATSGLTYRQMKAYLKQQSPLGSEDSFE